MTTSFDDLLGSPPAVDPTLRAEFDDAFLHDSSFFQHARKRAKHGLSHSSLRSLQWRLFLDTLSPERVDVWEAQLSQQRRTYDDLLRTYKVAPSAHEERQREQDERDKAQSNPPIASLPPPPTPHPPPSPPTDLKINNPLSTASSSPWRQYFHNSSLSQLITADLHRTEPDSGFFQSDGIQALMLNVLLVWAKQHSAYEYRQGMNELLAPIVLTVFKDCRAVDPSSTSPTPPLLASLLDRHYAEHDVFTLFTALMQIMAPFFAKIDQKPPLRTRTADSDDLLIGPPPPPTTQSPILMKCHHVHHSLLASLDPAVYRHLNAQDVQPQLYGLRWYRLLFAREFPLLDVCAVWDVAFSHTGSGGGGGVEAGGGFVFADYLCVAMLHYVRQALLQGDNTDCLRRLLHFPPVDDIRTLLDRALYFMGGRGSVSAGPVVVDESGAHQHHSEMQRFIAEYGSQLESSYLEDPLLLKRGAAAVGEGVQRVEALVKKGRGSKTMPGHGHGVNGGYALQHSASQGSLNPLGSVPLQPVAVPLSTTGPAPSQRAQTGQEGHVVQAAKEAQPAREVQTVKEGKATKGAAGQERVAHLLGVQAEMGQKLQAVIGSLHREWERVHKATTASLPPTDHPTPSAPLDDSTASDDGVDHPAHPRTNGANISVELEEHRSAHTVAALNTGMDMGLVSDALADLKHVADVLLGRLAHTPQVQEGEGGEEAGQLMSPTSAAASTFFVTRSVEDPKERLQRLLAERHRAEAHDAAPATGESLSIHIPQSGPVLKGGKGQGLGVGGVGLVGQPRSASAMEPRPQSSSPSSAPALRGLPVPSLAPVGPSLFDASPAVDGRSSSKALLSELLGGQKKSVFNDD